MADIIDELDEWLHSYLLLTGHCLGAVKCKKLLPEPEVSCPRKRRNCKMYCKLDSWNSMFGMDILNNPNIQILTQTEAIKFRRRFMVTYTVCLTIVAFFAAVTDGTQ